MNDSEKLDEVLSRLAQMESQLAELKSQPRHETAIHKGRPWTLAFITSQTSLTILFIVGILVFGGDVQTLSVMGLVLVGVMSLAGTALWLRSRRRKSSQAAVAKH